MLEQSPMIASNLNFIGVLFCSNDCLSCDMDDLRKLFIDCDLEKMFPPDATDIGNVKRTLSVTATLGAKSCLLQYF